MSMLRTSIGRRTSDGTAAAAAAEFIAAGKGFFLRELIVTLAAGTASQYGLGRPAAIGITPTTPVTSLLEGPGDAVPVTKSAIAWATGPTVPAQFFRRVGFPATIGTSIRWTWEYTVSSGLYVPAGGSLVLWNIGTNGVVDVTATVDEPQ